MSDEIKLLSTIITKLDDAIGILQSVEEHDDKAYQKSINAWRKLKQIKHAIKEHGGYEVERSGYEMKGSGSSSHNKEETHESFGTLAVSNISGSMRLVGTTTDFLPNCVRLTVHRSRRLIDENSHTEYYMPSGRPILQIEMSRNQWAEAICSQSGIGVPVTIRTVMGTSMEEVPKEVRSPFQQIIDDAKGNSRHRPKGADEFKKEVEGVISTIGDMKLPKTKTETIQKFVRKLYENHVSAVIGASSWASERLNEEAEKAVSQARVEVAASIESLINMAGMKALGIKANFTPQLRGVDSEDSYDKQRENDGRPEVMDAVEYRKGYERELKK